MSLAAELAIYREQIEAAAHERLLAIAERYADGDEPTPAEVLDALEAAGKTAEDLERLIEVEKQRLADVAQTRAEAEAARRQAERDERQRQAQVVLSQPAVEAEVAAIEAKAREAAEAQAREIAELTATLEAARKRHGDAIAAFRRESAERAGKITGEIADAKRQLAATADPQLAAEQLQLRERRLAILSRIDDETEQFETAERFLREVLNGRDGDKHHSLPRRQEDIRQRRNVIGKLRGMVAEIDAELATLEARKLLFEPAEQPPEWLVESVRDTTVRS